MKYPYLLILSLIFIFSCSNKNDKSWIKKVEDPEYLHRSIWRLTEAITNDIFPPPIAGRIYAYSSVAGYEALVPGNSQLISLQGQLNGLKDLPKPEAGQEYSFPIASIVSMLTVAKALVFSEEMITGYQAKIKEEYKNAGVPDDVLDHSWKYGEKVGTAILGWCTADKYKQLRSAPKFDINLKEDGCWRPTGPDYADALEPHWNQIVPMTMDSAAQFKPVRPTPFSKLKGTPFYNDAMEVFNAVKDSTKDRTATAWYWDDNSFESTTTGHAMSAVKKVSPGGHWINIAKEACKKSKADFYKSMEVYARLTVGIFDGFISCWDEKYRSKLIRPESYISLYISPKWTPIIQTPPFPEYTSGHSVISGASSEILTNLFGDNFSFTDSTETLFQMPPRTFKSFYEAADQAAISRMYAGIHYKPAIVNGLVQGKNIGKHVSTKIKTRK